MGASISVDVITCFEIFVFNCLPVCPTMRHDPYIEHGTLFTELSSRNILMLLSFIFSMR